MRPRPCPEAIRPTVCQSSSALRLSDTLGTPRPPRLTTLESSRAPRVRRAVLAVPLQATAPRSCSHHHPRLQRRRPAGHRHPDTTGGRTRPPVLARPLSDPRLRSNQTPADLTRRPRPQPPDHRQHPLPPHRARYRQRPAEDHGRPVAVPCSARSTTAAASPPEAPSCPARRTPTSTSPMPPPSPTRSPRSTW